MIEEVAYGGVDITQKLSLMIGPVYGGHPSIGQLCAEALGEITQLREMVEMLRMELESKNPFSAVSRGVLIYTPAPMPHDEFQAEIAKMNSIPAAEPWGSPFAMNTENWA